MGLAERELECVLRIAAGKSSKEIARDFGISAGSVDKRVLSASTKLGVIKRAALVGEALRRGLIAPACVALLAILLVGQHQQATMTRRPEGPRRIEMRVASRRVERDLVA